MGDTLEALSAGALDVEVFTTLESTLRSPTLLIGWKLTPLLFQPPPCHPLPPQCLPLLCLTLPPICQRRLPLKNGPPLKNQGLPLKNGPPPMNGLPLPCQPLKNGLRPKIGLPPKYGLPLKNRLPRRNGPLLQNGLPLKIGLPPLCHRRQPEKLVLTCTNL